MTCPSCGGTSRAGIAPGYWRCTSLVAVKAAGPGMSGLPGPPVLTSYALCGHEYQDGIATSTLVCDCGTFAIGICAGCGAPACGNHSSMIEERRLCGACRNAHTDALRLAEHQRKDDDAEAVVLRRSQREAELEAIKGWLVRVATALATAGEPLNSEFRLPNGEVAKGWHIQKVDEGWTTQDVGYSSRFGEPNYRQTERFWRERQQVLLSGGRLAAIQRRKASESRSWRRARWELDGYKYLDPTEVSRFRRLVEANYRVRLPD